MAFVHSHYQLEVNFLDVGRKTSSKVYEILGADFDAATTNAAALLSDLTGVTALEITGYRLTDVIIEDTVVVPTSPIASRKKVARLTIQLASSPLKTDQLEIPGPVDTLFVGAPGTTGYDIVDIGDTFVNNYVDNFKASGGTATMSDGENAAATNAVIKGFRVTRSSTFKNAG